MDNDLGWRWKGANLTPSFDTVISISSSPARWAEQSFTRKACIERGVEEAKEEFLKIFYSVLKKIVSQKEATELP